GEAWVEAHEVSRTGGRERRDALLDALLTGRDPADLGLGDLATDLGLTTGAGVIVLSARPVQSRSPSRVLTSAVGAFARAGAPTMIPLARLQDDEIVVVRPVAHEDLHRLVAALDARGGGSRTARCASPPGSAPATCCPGARPTRSPTRARPVTGCRPAAA
uniref:hypothetical protein n=1 Tax=Paraconexibacter sp. TaxID=2949640 RepID=UPI003566D508